MIRLCSLLFALLITMVSFQNCSGPARFDGSTLVSKNDPLETGELSDEGDLFSLDGEELNIGDDAENIGGEKDDDEKKEVADHDEDNDRHNRFHRFRRNHNRNDNRDCKDNDNEKKEVADKDDAEDKKGPAHADGDKKVICILEGPGKSIRLGIQDGEGARNGRTPSTVCMTKNACLNIASEVFDVKEAHPRGFCPDKNPNVRQMDDDEVQKMCDQKKNIQ